MIDNVDAVAAAIATGVNAVRAIQDASGYNLEQLSIVSGLSELELIDLEASDADRVNAGRLLHAFGIPTS
jgi:hypothetical protein